MSENIKNTKTSFWQVIAENSIVIPQIQRDYAQGRDDIKAVDIRNKILIRFHKPISTPNNLDIDFIYGYNSDHKFIPLDGQQRLTTLFLIHWYIAKNANKIAEVEILRRFRYETRQSSTDFCQAILDEPINFDEADLKKWILDQRWFFHSWKKDPTIISMLNMIYDIHFQFGGSDFIQLWDNICNKRPITFNFLSIEDTGLTDDLYIKMNSRGKILTTFENFKVWFQKKYPDNLDWQNKIDNDWTNLFWKHRDAFKSSNSNDDTMDDEFMQFINGMLMFGFVDKGFQDEIQFFANNNEIALSKYENENLNCFSCEDVVFITNALDYQYIYNDRFIEILADINFWQDKSLFKAVISNKPTYYDRIRYYCIVHYMSHSKSDEIISESFRRWMQFSRNIIENTTIDSPSAFNSAVKSINAIGENCLDIHHYLRNPANKISFFLPSQIVEERLKTILIENKSEWEHELLNAENHELFRGCISFLLLSKEWERLEDFIQKRDIAKEIFGKDGSVEYLKKDYILIRAMLTKSTINENVVLLDNGANWRELLKKDKVKFAISEIITLLKNSQNYSAEIQLIISEYTDKTILWKFNIIHYKVLLSGASTSRSILRGNDNEMYLYREARWNNYYDNNTLISNYRNNIVTNFIKLDSCLSIKNDWIKFVDSDTGSFFYRGWEILLHKSINNYKLRLSFQPQTLIVGFHEDDAKGLIEIKENLEIPINKWLIARSYSPYPQQEEDFQDWIENVLNGIHEIENIVIPIVLDLK
jgi:hypothetical protein